LLALNREFSILTGLNWSLGARPELRLAWISLILLVGWTVSILAQSRQRIFS